jgi:aerobic C4-dicarboxylate transport protein
MTQTSKSPFRLSLSIQVLLAIFAGILLGIFSQETAVKMKFLSDIFINLIKMSIAPIIFLTIVGGVGSMNNMKKLGRVGGKSLLYFEVVTTFALFIGLFVANVIKPGEGMDISSIEKVDVSQYTNAKPMDWLAFVIHIFPSNIIQSFAEGNIIQVVFFALLFGIAVSRLGETGTKILHFFDKLSQVFFKILSFIMVLAPIGAFGGIAFTIGKYGVSALFPLLKLMLSGYCTMFLFVFIVLNLLCYFSGFSLWKFIVYIKEEILIVVGTASSETVLPRMMDKLEKYGCSRSVVSLVIPTGYSFNLDGTTIYLSMCVIFLAQVYKIPLTWQQEMGMIAVLMVTSKGAAAVTGSGFLVLASTLSSMHIIPVEGIALLIGIDRFMSEARAVTNLIGNGVATLLIAKSEGEYQEKEEIGNLA